MPLFRLYQYSIVVGCKTRERLELGTLNFICSISTKNKQHVFFLEEDEGGGGGGRTFYGRVMPFFRLGYKNLVNTIS